jgi:hypothetical protein
MKIFFKKSLNYNLFISKTKDDNVDKFILKAFVVLKNLTFNYLQLVLLHFFGPISEPNNQPKLFHQQPDTKDLGQG